MDLRLDIVAGLAWVSIGVKLHRFGEEDITQTVNGNATTFVDDG